jgi:hypothetical protein
MHWNEFSDGLQVHKHFAAIADKIRSGSLEIGRKTYALSLSIGVFMAIVCKYPKIVAVEFGVGRGGGLLDLCTAAHFFRNEVGIEIDVYGLDNGTGLPPTNDYRDQPELWATGQFKNNDIEGLRAKLPDFAHLVIGDIAETTPTFRSILGPHARLGFVSIDVDYYSSTMAALRILRFDKQCYLPVVPMYFDDMMAGMATYNTWCGEPLAIEHFNRDSEFRKIQATPFFAAVTQAGIKAAGCQILDHPLRNGEEVLRRGFPLRHVRMY